MKPSRILHHLSLAALAGLAGCATLDVKQPTVEQTAEIRKGPEDRPQRSITGFSHALRCMDTLMLDYGVRDITVLTEEITDETKKLNAGTRDMLISAVSDMSRRSRAVRLVAFGRDTPHLVGFLTSAQSAAAFQAIPLYDIKGSITQLDENLIRNQKDVGFGILSPLVNLGVARDAASSMLALDLSVLTTSDMAVLPGVTSRNSVIILKQGTGVDGDAAYSKFGVRYSMSLARTEGQAQALRGLVELAAVELVGKLTKTPYWSCLDVANPAANEETRLEMFDWYHSMAATGTELMTWFQKQLRHRRFYDGPIDGRPNPAIDQAIASYRGALGLSREPLLSEDFFYAFLAADHGRIQRPEQAARHVAPPAVAAAPAATPRSAGSPAPASAPAAMPLRLSLTHPRQQTRFERGESYSLALTPSRDAHVYCYLQDEDAQVIRFFPNRFSRDSLVAAARPLTLPGAQRFQLTMNQKGVTETVSCFATPEDVAASLPPALVGTDFEPLPGATLELLRAAFEKASGGKVAQENFRVQAR
jgi:curli biogenesis system outer membrane secretion channel CsgG